MTLRKNIEREEEGEGGEGGEERGSFLESLEGHHGWGDRKTYREEENDRNPN